MKLKTKFKHEKAKRINLKRPLNSNETNKEIKVSLFTNKKKDELNFPKAFRFVNCIYKALGSR